MDNEVKFCNACGSRLIEYENNQYSVCTNCSGFSKEN